MYLINRRAGLTIAALVLAVVWTRKLSAQTQLISRTRPVLPGMAPHMQAKLIHQGGGEKTYVIIFVKGDEVISGLTDFARDYKVSDAHFTGIGAASSVVAGWYDLTQKAYVPTSTDEQVEVMSFMGDIALFEGKAIVHAHASSVKRDGSTTGGHLFGLHANPTLEVFMTVDDVALHKRADPVSSQDLIAPSL